MKAPKLPRPFAKRLGPLSKAEKAIVHQYLADLPREITPDQVKTLARLMHRYPKTIRECIEQARDEFARNSKTYVQLHMDSAQKAFDAGDYETAAKAAQWAIEHISSEGVRIVEAIDKRASGPSDLPKVVIGVALGGLGLPSKPAEAEPVDVTDEE